MRIDIPALIHSHCLQVKNCRRMPYNAEKTDPPNISIPIMTAITDALFSENHWDTKVVMLTIVPMERLTPARMDPRAITKRLDDRALMTQYTAVPINPNKRHR